VRFVSRSLVTGAQSFSLSNGTATSADQAPSLIEAILYCSNESFAKDPDDGRLASPTVHILKPGTSTEYRALKIKAAITGASQVKLPAVLSACEAQEWMLRHVEKVVVRHDP